MEEGFRGRGRGASANTMSAGSISGGSAGGGGWPLGLQPLHVMSRLAAAASNTSRELQLFNLLHYSRRNHIHGVGPELASISPFFLSTPSISSLSSSDLDTESTGSFFPERSTTLGSLIGIHHPRQAGHVAHRLRGATGGADGPPLHVHDPKHHHLKTTQRLHACWCAAFTLLLRCASSHCRAHATDVHSLSPSLAHLLELERQAAHSRDHYSAYFQCETIDDDITIEDGDYSHHQHTSSLNTLFDNDGILPPHPAGAPLRVAQLHPVTTSPTNSTYLSGDWSGSVPIPTRTKHYHLSNTTSNNSLCPRFWKIS